MRQRVAIDGITLLASMNNCIVIDCSGQVLSVAIAVKGNPSNVWHETIHEQHGQAEMLAPLANRVFAATPFKQWAELDCILVCRGPGGFTGLRVSIAFALGLAASIPGVIIRSISTDAYWRYRITNDPCLLADNIYCAVDTRRGDCYLRSVSESGSAWMIARDLNGQIGSSDSLVVGNSGLIAALRDQRTIMEEIDTAALAVAVLDPQFDTTVLTNILQPLYVRPPTISRAKDTKFGPS